MEKSRSIQSKRSRAVVARLGRPRESAAACADSTCRYSITTDVHITFTSQLDNVYWLLEMIIQSPLKLVVQIHEWVGIRGKDVRKADRLRATTSGTREIGSGQP